MKRIGTKLSSIIPRRLTYCDIGAGAPGMKEPWKSFRALVKTVSIEADKERFDVLKNKNNENETVLNYAVYSSACNTHFNIARGPSRCSMLEPDMEFLRKYPNSEWFEVKETVPVRTVTLDHLYKTEKIMRPLDFLKIIVNGVELDILTGGKDALQEVLGVQLAVEFQPLWKGEGSFWDIDYFMKENTGLELQDIRKYYYKYTKGVEFGGKKGRLIFCDALYFRSPEGVLSLCAKLNEKEACEKIYMACVMAVVYGYCDYALHLLSLPEVDEYISRENIAMLSKIIKGYFRSITIPDFLGKGRLADLIAIIYGMLEPYNGYKYNDRPLGNSKRFGIFFN